MAITVSLSTRLPPDVRERLVSVAAARGLAPGSLARDLIAAGLDSPEPGRAGAGDLVREVECVFSHFGPEAGLRREVCLALARTAESGGSAGIAAGKELVIEVSIAQGLFVPELDDEDYDDLLRASDQGGEPGCGVNAREGDLARDTSEGAGRGR